MSCLSTGPLERRGDGRDPAYDVNDLEYKLARRIGDMYNETRQNVIDVDTGSILLRSLVP